ncbi:MAG: hypothetical protein GY703_16520 [Gammaproteobacteria bacterium]|nr:hypothetical protein [Gammaproteobacteria bacterium]
MMKRIVLTAALCSAFATSVPFAAETAKIEVGSGSDGGFYYTLMTQIGSEFDKRYKNDKTPVEMAINESPGTLHNIEQLTDGEWPLVIVQADGLAQAKGLPGGLQVYNAHQEAVYFLINKKAHEELDIDDLEDIEGKKDLHLAIVDGSGAYVTLTSFVKEDSGYKPNLENAISFETMYDAAEAVAAGTHRIAGSSKKVIGMLYVSRPGAISNDILEDFRESLIVGEATDKDFNDALDFNKEPLYQTCDITSKQLQGMKGATYGDQKTVCVRAQVAYDPERIKRLVPEKKDQKKVIKAVKKALNGTLKHVR